MKQRIDYIDRMKGMVIFLVGHGTFICILRSNGNNPQGKTFASEQMTEEFKFYDKGREIVNKIGNDCWFGSNVTLIGGIEIHDGTVVLAHAIVTKDVPPYAIVGGTPARIIDYRYMMRIQ